MESAAVISDADAATRLKAIFDQTAVGIAEVDLTGRFVLVNDRYCEIVGRSREELLGGLTMQALTHPEDLPANMASFGRLLEHGTGFVIEKRYLRPDGSDIWVRNTVSRIDDPDGPSFVLAVSQDISEQKAAEMAMRNSEVRYRRIFESAGVSLWEEDFSDARALIDRLLAEGVTDIRAHLERNPELVREAMAAVRIVDVNEHTLELFGARDKAELTRSLNDVFLEESLDTFCEELVAMAEGRELVSGPVRMRTLDGQLRDMLFAMRLPDPGESYESVTVALVDVTERAEADRARGRFVDLVQGLDAIVWEADATTFQFTFVSQRAEELTGYPVDRWLSEPTFWADHIHPEDRRPTIDLCTTATRQAQDHEFEYRMITADGRTLWLRDLVHVVSDDDGSPRLLRGLMVDVTSRKQAEQAREAFAGILSHELRTPVTTILGASELLLRRAEGMEGERKDLITDIAAEAKRLGRLVEDLLVLSRSEGNQLVIDPEPVLVQHSIRTTIAAEAERFPEIEFRAMVPPLPPVAADRTYLDQILRNLISNAAKYSPDGPATVEVMAEEDGDAVAVRVLDSGIGFPPEESERLFDLFYRSDRARRRAGAGIGLYVTRALVEAMGGRVWARQRPGGGSEFGFTLPVMAGARVDIDAATGSALRTAAGT
jgi:PAS domain S-box-containing protein